MNTKAIIEELEPTSQSLLEALGSFQPNQLNTRPAYGGWTAGQVGEHLRKASVVDVLFGPTKPAQRPPDEYVATLRDQFLNFSIQMTSPDFIVPADRDYDRESLLQTLQQVGTQVREAAQTLNLTEICLYTPSALGELTRYELIHFHISHTKRHIHQLRKIHEAVVSQTDYESNTRIGN
jgi:hypothetical protein